MQSKMDQKKDNTKGGMDNKGTNWLSNSSKVAISELKSPSQESPDVIYVFSFAQIISACFVSFSHGSNDTANAVGPLVGVWSVYKTGVADSDDLSTAVLEALILFGSMSMIVGLWCLGHKVIDTVGERFTKITSVTGFCMEVATAFAVLFCSKIDCPVSTTHCLIGSVVALGWYRNRTPIQWKLFGNVALAWIFTLPIAGGTAALIAFGLAQSLYINHW